MTVRKGWKTSDTPDTPITDTPTADSPMPRLSLLTRPMVGRDSLRVHDYQIKASGSKPLGAKTYSLADVTDLEIQPFESTYGLIFTDIKSGEFSMNIKDIIDVKVASVTKGRLSKKEDLIVEIQYISIQDRKPNVLRIDVEDKYADEIVKEIRLLKQLESDSTYWIHRSLIFSNQDGQEIKVDIYPLTPFLAKGEEIVWQSLKSDLKTDEGIVLWIDVVTNFRVFQYGFQEHKGAVILFPSVDDVKISHESHGAGLGAYNSSSSYLTGIQSSGAIEISGDLVFYYQGSLWITFTQVADPETLLTVVKTLNERQSNIQIEDGKTEETIDSPPKIEFSALDSGQQTGLLCVKCNNQDNPVNSKFCNKCGSPLSLVCAKCGNSNQNGALFCGQCGSKLGE